MEIRSLANTDFDTLFKAFSLAFANYDIQMNSLQLKAMFKRRGYNPELSFAMFDGGKIVSFLFNGTGNFYGIPTAYDTGTGTLPDYRGKGLSLKIFEYAVPVLRKANIQQYLLEVLQHNTGAVSVYKNAGFETTREFNYFIQKNEEINNQIKASDTEYSINPLDIDKCCSISDFWDFCPSWQNCFESINRAADGIICLGAFEGEKLTGYCVFEPVSGDISQIAIDKKYRRKGIASLLLGEMIKLNRKDTVKIVNTEISCESVTDFFVSKNINVTGKLFEMIKKI